MWPFSTSHHLPPLPAPRSTSPLAAITIEHDAPVPQGPSLRLFSWSPSLFASFPPSRSPLPLDLPLYPCQNGTRATHSPPNNLHPFLCCQVYLPSAGCYALVPVADAARRRCQAPPRRLPPNLSPHTLSPHPRPERTLNRLGFPCHRRCLLTTKKLCPLPKANLSNKFPLPVSFVASSYHSRFYSDLFVLFLNCLFLPIQAHLIRLITTRPLALKQKADRSSLFFEQ